VCDFTEVLSDSGPCKVSVTSGTPVTLTAVAEPNATSIPADRQADVPDYPTSDATFVRWSRSDCAGTGSCTFTPDTDFDWVAAFFSPLELEVGINNGGNAGSSDTVRVVQGGGPLTCDSGLVGFFDADRACHGLYPVDASLVLQAQPGSAGTPIQWGFGCEPDNGESSSANCTVTMSNIRTFAVVAFGAGVAPPSFPFQIEPHLSVHLSGSGRGRVSGTGNIDCGTACSADLRYQQKVTLTATADQGSTFVRWRGVCSTSPTCAFAAGSATSVSAVFDQAAPPPPPPTTSALPTTTSAPPTTTTPPPATTTSSGTSTTATVRKPTPKRLSARLAGVRQTGSGAHRALVFTLVVSRSTRVRTQLLAHGQAKAHGAFAVPRGRSTFQLALGRSVKPGRYQLVFSLGSGAAARTLARPIKVRA
jgi:hypothetical protein